MVMRDFSVAGLWELGWNTPLQEHDLWVFPLRDYGAAAWSMAPVTGIRSEMVHEVNELGAALEAERELGRTIVHVDENGSETLDEFQHPLRACYVFGKASLSSMRAYGGAGDRSVRIVTPHQLALLWPHQAMVLVLNDRSRKAWPSR